MNEWIYQVVFIDAEQIRKMYIENIGFHQNMWSACSDSSIIKLFFGTGSTLIKVKGKILVWFNTEKVISNLRHNVFIKI